MPPRVVLTEGTWNPATSILRLNQLPAEILQKIFDFLHTDNESAQPNLSKPLSKHLRPYSTKALYRSIKICSSLNLGRLEATISRVPALAPLVEDLHLHGSTVKLSGGEETAELFERNLENLLISLIRIRYLEIDRWSLAAKVVFSDSAGGFAQEGGKVLETLKVWNSFTLVDGMAWYRLRNLPRLTTINSGASREPSLPLQLALPETGFKQVSRLCCKFNFPSAQSTHFACMFPMITELQLVHQSEQSAADYLPLLSAIQSLFLTHIVLDCRRSAKFDASRDTIHQVFPRFINLSSIKFLDRRLFDDELINALLTVSKLTSLTISRNCVITYEQLMCLLHGLKKRKMKAPFILALGLEMEIGSTGVTFREGAEAVLGNGILVPGEGWKMPVWGAISRQQANELIKLADDAEVTLRGAIPKAIKNEEDFQKEVAWLDDGMYFIRTGKTRGL